MKKIFSFVLALAMILSLAACGGNSNTTNNTANSNDASTVVPVEDVKAMSYAEYMAAGEDAAVVIEGYVQLFAYNKSYGNVSMFIQSDEGAYYAYRAVCSEDQAAGLAEGVHVKVSGKKTLWSGEIEVAEGGSFEILEGNKVYPVTDVTSDFRDPEKLIAKMNQKISAKGFTVTPSADQEGKPVAFLYNWDSSGASGKNNDIYFKAALDGTEYTFTVESDEWPEGSAPYAAATSLNIGDVIDLEGMLYWYNGPNVHVSGINVVRENKADTAKGQGVLSFEEFLAAEPEAEASVEGYIQFFVYDKENQNVTMYLSDADGSYYIPKAACDDALSSKLAVGTKVKVSGIKAVSGGLDQLQEGSTVEAEEGFYTAMSTDAAALLGNDEALKALAASKVKFSGLVIEASSIEAEEDEHAFLYGRDGSGQEGSNSDLYFRASKDGKTYTFMVESDEIPEGSEAYKAVTGLKIGDTVDLEGFLFWDETALPHIHDIKIISSKQ